MSEQMNDMNIKINTSNSSRKSQRVRQKVNRYKPYNYLEEVNGSPMPIPIVKETPIVKEENKQEKKREKKEIEHYYQPSDLKDSYGRPKTFSTMSYSDLQQLENWRESYVSWLIRQPFPSAN